MRVQVSAEEMGQSEVQADISIRIVCEAIYKGLCYSQQTEDDSDFYGLPWHYIAIKGVPAF